MKLILFDIDGTLVDCGPQMRPIFGAALEAVFGTAGPIDAYDFSGRTDGRIAADLLAAAGVSGERVAAGLPAAKARYFELLERRLDAAAMRLLPAVAATLDALARRPDVALGLVTGNWETGARIKLGRVGLDRFFPCGAFGDDGREREALPPRALARAGEHYGRRFAAADAIIVGDTVHDVACARAHGIEAVAVATGRQSAGELAAAGAHRVLAGIAELL